jgi:hypothetical protein
MSLTFYIVYNEQDTRSMYFYLASPKLVSSIPGVPSPSYSFAISILEVYIKNGIRHNMRQSLAQKQWMS